MPGKDLTRWTENEDGSWTRLRLATDGEVEEVVEDDLDLEEVVDEALEVVEEQAVAEEEAEYDATSGAVEAAAKLGVDLSSVTGTGLEGRITKADVEAAANA